MWALRVGKRLAEDRRGSALIEMAAVLPVMVAMFSGIVAYGTAFSLNHAVQQSAQEGARAAIAGLSQAERFQIADDVTHSTLAATWGVHTQDITTETEDDGQTLTVKVTYNAATNPMLGMPLIPKPDTVITRRATVRLVGL